MILIVVLIDVTRINITKYVKETFINKTFKFIRFKYDPLLLDLYGLEVNDKIDFPERRWYPATNPSQPPINASGVWLGEHFGKFLILQWVSKKCPFLNIW
jgi:hypothetical protein